MVLAAQPGGEPPGQWLDLATHQLEVLLARGGEVDLLDRRPDGVAGNVLRAADLGRAAAYLTLDELLERPSLGLDELARGGVVPPVLVAEHAPQRLLDELVGGDPVQHVVRRPPLLARPAPPDQPEPLHPLAREHREHIGVAHRHRDRERVPEVGQRLRSVLAHVVVVLLVRRSG